jgi:predicted  nucleic acid-binding Zn-ribbon protein
MEKTDTKSQIENMIQRVDKRINTLKGQLEVAKEETRPELRAQIQSLETRKRELIERLNDLPTVNEKKWTEFKQQIDRLNQQTEEQLQRLTSNFTPS